ncbi:MAG: hypothetical protein ACNI3A_18105 [Desulfovibrio sp.]|uniref:hypothetical protein n=1 Tax=Desulfovibrio sp. 7SRBS1 TaxID=3378064 RepID=UPI003B4017E0
MSQMTLEQEAELKRTMYEKLSPRRRKFIDKMGYNQWDPFQKPLDPIDLRQDNNQLTTQELIRGFLQQVPEERYNDVYAKGAFEMALGIINESERQLGMYDFACWYMRLLEDKEKLKKGESLF